MHASKFCLNIARDTPFSNRLFDAIASHCVPVVISDEIELPYEDVLDYSSFCIFVRTSDAIKKRFLIELIRGISREAWTKMWQRLKEVEGYFEYQYPSKKHDAVQMIWQAVARKVPAIQLKLHRAKEDAIKVAEENQNLKHEFEEWKNKFKELEESSMDLDRMTIERDALQKEIRLLQQRCKNLEKEREEEVRRFIQFKAEDRTTSLRNSKRVSSRARRHRIHQQS